MAVENDSDSQIASILEKIAGADLSDERIIAKMLLPAQLASAEKQVIAGAVLKEEDIPKDALPLIKSLVGEKFIKFNNGTWYGDGGNHGPSTPLGKTMENALARETKEKEAQGDQPLREGK